MEHTNEGTEERGEPFNCFSLAPVSGPVCIASCSFVYRWLMRSSHIVFAMLSLKFAFYACAVDKDAIKKRRLNWRPVRAKADVAEFLWTVILLSCSPAKAGR